MFIKQTYLIHVRLLWVLLLELRKKERKEQKPTEQKLFNENIFLMYLLCVIFSPAQHVC